MARSEGQDAGCFAMFPFEGGFEQVVQGDVTLPYLDRLAMVLEPMVEVAAEAVESGEVHETTVVTLLYSTVALARIRVVQAYSDEILQLDQYVEGAVLSALQTEWDAMVERDQMVFVGYSPLVDAVMGDTIRTMWREHAFSRMLVAKDVLVMYRPIASTLRVVTVGGILVESSKGKRIDQLPPTDMHLSVISQADYRLVMSVVKTVPAGTCDPMSVKEVVQALGSSFSLSAHDMLVDWVWLVASSLGCNHGYCYQLVMHPATRFVASQVLGQNPKVSELLWYLLKLDVHWAESCAEIDYGEVLHVSRSGCPPVDELNCHLECVIGMGPSPVANEPDYFARALVDQFINKHRRPVVQEPVPLPVDSAFESLSLHTSSSGGSRGFVDVATELYAGIGEMVSPRTEESDKLFGGVASTDDHLNERDSERVREVYTRLGDGAVIDELYFRRSRRRFSRQRSRPRLYETAGRAYHVFAGFPADGGGGLGPWQEDSAWDIPGWRSYIATFDPGDRTLSFVAPDTCADVRMDCSGDGALEFGDCKVATSGTVLWFTQSVKFHLISKGIVDLRISVPDAGSASAIGVDMRRYLYIPGYAVAVRSFDVVVGNPTISIPVKRKRGSLIAGCHFYAGCRFIPRGRHRFKLIQLPSLAPIKMVVKTEPVSALAYLSVCGMRLKPHSRDYVTVLYNPANSELYITMNDEAEVQVSIAQVVRFAEFDLTVASMRRDNRDEMDYVRH